MEGLKTGLLVVMVVLQLLILLVGLDIRRELMREIVITAPAGRPL